MCRITTYQLVLDALRLYEHEALPMPAKPTAHRSGKTGKSKNGGFD
jgi:hypothetical protein